MALKAATQANYYTHGITPEYYIGTQNYLEFLAGRAEHLNYYRHYLLMPLITYKEQTSFFMAVHRDSKNGSRALGP